MDLVMLDPEGYLSYYERTDKDGLAPGKRIFVSQPGEYNRKNQAEDSAYGRLRLNTDKYGASGRRKLAFGDWDGDGDQDIIINNINAALIENQGDSSGFVKMKLIGDLSDQKLAGHTTSPTLVDWDKDGKPDLLLGAEDGHFYYMKHN